ncbi:hypothetical protein ACFV3R_05715 [Streptomyces sp. NPDC059740]|uniref:hypothetical protein n=1 Tax=Streptomyces sp. NPDC059740 TaxID=3346926 RepID=UPI0036696253
MDTTDTTKTGTREDEARAEAGTDDTVTGTSASAKNASAESKAAATDPKEAATAKPAGAAGTTTTDKSPADGGTAEKAGKGAGEGALMSGEKPATGGGEPVAGTDGEAAAADDVLLVEEEPAQRRSPVGAGVAAVVSAGLGLASVTGTWLGTVMSERQTLVGQIKVQSGKATDQLAAVYGQPWHTTALVNAVFAVLALLVGLLGVSGRGPAWVRSVAWGGVVLGLIGLVIAALTYFGVLAGVPQLPAGAGAGAGGGATG